MNLGHVSRFFKSTKNQVSLTQYHSILSLIQCQNIFLYTDENLVQNNSELANGTVKNEQTVKPSTHDRIFLDKDPCSKAGRASF